MEEKYLQGYVSLTDYEPELMSKDDAFELIANYWFYQGAFQTGGLVEEHMSNRQRLEWEDAKGRYNIVAHILLKGEQK